MSCPRKYRPKQNKFEYNVDCHNLYNILTRPIIVGYMSVNVNRQYHSDLSQLKFLKSNFDSTTSLDLNHNIDNAVKRTTDDNDEKIDLLLKFIMQRNDYITTHYNTIDIITYRRTLISVMCSSFGSSEPLIIKACSFKGAIYLCSIENPQEIQRRKSRSKDEEKFCAWGYKFEQYMVSDQPNLSPNVQKAVIENEEFSLFYYTTLGDLKLLYGAQIDALLTNERTTETPKCEDFETNLTFLRNNKFAELKTNREIGNFKQERNFKRYKLLRCWCQCLLADLSGLLVGFRNDQGIVQRLKWFNTQEIVTYCQNEWNPQKALNFLHYILSYIKNCFHQRKNEMEPFTLQFKIDIHKEIFVEECNNDILPNWFRETFEKS